jgi:hypothetical protein
LEGGYHTRLAAQDAPPPANSRREQRKSQQNHVLRQLLRCDFCLEAGMPEGKK